MNKSKIEWCDYTWNPVTGCRHGCEFCYARRIDKRFGDGTFTPTFHPERLQDPLKVKKPSRIFVGSMADLFGDWMWNVYENGDEEGFPSGLFSREYVVKCILNIATQCPQHTFMFLTKNPKGMQGIDFPANCWCGTSVENQEKADERIPELLRVKCKTLFVSYEPALGPIDFSRIALGNNVWVNAVTGDCNTYSPFGGLKTIESSWRQIDWLIIGAQTGPGAVPPNMDWIHNAIAQAQNAKVPVFVKDNVGRYTYLREFPGVSSL